MGTYHLVGVRRCIKYKESLRGRGTVIRSRSQRCEILAEQTRIVHIEDMLVAQPTEPYILQWNPACEHVPCQPWRIIAKKRRGLQSEP
jgi:hypothetical protein